MVAGETANTDDLDAAEQQNESWQRRHNRAYRLRHGAWRWAGLIKHRHRLQALLNVPPGGIVLDFGGADAPISRGAVICDVQHQDCWGRPVVYQASRDMRDESVDVVFTSHALEHCPHLRLQIRDLTRALKPGGPFIVHVPAWTCTRWRASEYENPNQDNPHYWTFGLLADDPHELPRRDSVTLIDDLLAQLVGPVEFASHCGDNSLLVIARKPRVISLDVHSGKLGTQS